MTAFADSNRYQSMPVLIGTSWPEQLIDSLPCLTNLEFGTDELARIDSILQTV